MRIKSVAERVEQLKHPQEIEEYLEDEPEKTRRFVRYLVRYIEDAMEGACREEREKRKQALRSFSHAPERMIIPDTDTNALYVEIKQIHHGDNSTESARALDIIHDVYRSLGFRVSISWHSLRIHFLISNIEDQDE